MKAVCVAIYLTLYICAWMARKAVWISLKASWYDIDEDSTLEKYDEWLDKRK